MFDTNLLHVIEPTYMLCYAIKWLDQKKVTTHALCDFPGYAKNKTNDELLARQLWSDLDKADICIAHNGDSFDFKKINARFAVHNIGPPTPYKTIDTLKIARRNFKFDSNKLDNIGRYLQVGRKLSHTGKDLWLGCMAGDPKSWRIMRRYNAQDVTLLENVYLKLRAWDKGHPNLSLYSEAPGCPVCRSDKVQRRGWNIARARKTPRLQCQECAAWFSQPEKKAVDNAKSCAKFEGVRR